MPESGQEIIEEIDGIHFRIRRSLRRTCQLTVEKDGCVTVRMPLLSTEAEAGELIVRHHRWILNRIRKREALREPETAEGKLNEKEKYLLKNKAKRVIPARVAFYAEKIGVSYGNISFRFQKSRWGSCSAKGNLNFNCLLMLAPQEVLDSVIVHELCHRKHMDHSKEFYQEIERILPDYKRNHCWLKENGEKLMDRL